MLSQSYFIPNLHRFVGNRLGARHREHRAIAEVRFHRSEAEPAVAEHHRRDAVPTRDCAVRIPANLRIVMGMKVDEAGRDDEAISRCGGRDRSATATIAAK
jgi:hypothetical protein